MTDPIIIIMSNRLSCCNKYTDLVVDMEFDFSNMLHDFWIVEEDHRRLEWDLKYKCFISISIKLDYSKLFKNLNIMAMLEHAFLKKLKCKTYS